MDYSKLSDFEVNIRVATCLRILEGGFQGVAVWCSSGGDCGEWLDWCNNWSDAGQLMEDNNIDLVFMENSGGEWSASGGKYFESDNVNPKRAIAECFLNMNE